MRDSWCLQTDLLSRLKTLTRDKGNAEAQNESLTQNQAAFMEKLKGAESKCTDLQTENVDLKEQVSATSQWECVQRLLSTYWNNCWQHSNCCPDTDVSWQLPGTIVSNRYWAVQQMSAVWCLSAAEFCAFKDPDYRIHSIKICRCVTWWCFWKLAIWPVRMQTSREALPLQEKPGRVKGIDHARSNATPQTESRCTCVTNLLIA